MVFDNTKGFQHSFCCVDNNAIVTRAEAFLVKTVFHVSPCKRSFVLETIGLTGEIYSL